MWPYNINCYKLKSNNIELKVIRNKKVTFQISGTTQKGALFGLLLNFKKQLLHIVAPPPPPPHPNFTESLPARWELHMLEMVGIAVWIIPEPLCAWRSDGYFWLFGEAVEAWSLKRVHVLSVRHTLRFWNAAFFDAVHCERKKRSPTTRWVCLILASFV